MGLSKNTFKRDVYSNTSLLKIREMSNKESNIMLKATRKSERLLLNQERCWYSWPPEEKNSI